MNFSTPLLLRIQCLAFTSITCFALVGCGPTSTPATSFPAPTPTATPVFTPLAGTYTSTQSVTISDSTAGAAIYYTVDGSTPTIASKLYSTQLTIAANTTLQAVAIATGSTLSGIASGAYTITPPAATPTLSAIAGTYNTTQIVTLTDVTPGATIYYTIDGTTPTTSSAKYAAPLSVASTTTVQAIATATGYITSAVASAAYTIVPSNPTISLSAGIYTSVQSLTLTDTAAAAKIYYTTDGTTPSASSTLYTGPITISTSETLNAIAILTNQASAIATAAYVINLPPASLVAYTGSNQSAEVGVGFGAPLQVEVLDVNSKPIVGATVSFAIPSTGPAATLSASNCVTSSAGFCSVTARANSSLGTFTAEASISTLSAAFTLTNTGLHSYVVTVATDTTTGVASNCIDEAINSGSGNANCSLRDALAAAAATATSSQNATITFAQKVASTITEANGSLAIPSYTTIQGATSGAGATLTNLITISGNGANNVFTATSAVTQAALNNVTITNGFTNSVGGGIYTYGSLTINNCTFLANQAALSGGAISNNGGTLTVFGSTFVNNIAQSSSGYGGGIDNFGGGTVSVSNSTFFGNQAAYGGGLYNSSVANIVASTFSGNTAGYGGGIYNLSTGIGISSSIVTGNNVTVSTVSYNCGGIFCNPQWTYVLFTALTSSPVDTNSINIAFSDNLQNTFSQTVIYGMYSTPYALASALGSYFFGNFSGRDTTSIGAQAFGTLLVITPGSGTTLNPFTITNPGKSFSAVQMFYPLALSLNGNVHDLTASQVNLSPLGNNGGPTQTMLPLAGSAALCAITPSTAAGTDQRGQPRAVTVGTATCQDAGAVQTSN